MFTLTIFCLIAVGLTTFMLDSTKSIFWATNKSKITSDMRIFTMQISKETLGARTGILYKDFSASARNQYEDRKQSGETGDCLVLVYYEPYPDIDDDLCYTKFVIYYRKADEDGLSPIYRAEQTFSTPQEIDTSSGADHFETFLATYFPDDSGEATILLDESRGLADGSLFRNLSNDTFVVNGEILHGNEVKEVTNTYNLTISPRG
jgi:hypothetical protein